MSFFFFFLFFNNVMNNEPHMQYEWTIVVIENRIWTLVDRIRHTPHRDMVYKYWYLYYQENYMRM